MYFIKTIEVFCSCSSKMYILRLLRHTVARNCVDLQAPYGQNTQYFNIIYFKTFVAIAPFSVSKYIFALLILV